MPLISNREFTIGTIADNHFFLLLTACFLLGISTVQAQGEDGFSSGWEIQPEFPGGNEALFSYIDSMLHYPREAIDKKIEGRVITNFVIEKNGSVTDVKIVRGVDPLLDEEAKRIISSMPNWTPGISTGDTVRVRFTLPISFRLNEEGEPIPYKEAVEKERAQRRKKVL